MKLTLANLALKLNGDIVGDTEIKLNNIAKIEYAKKGDITFLSNKKYLPWLKKTKASLIIVNKDFDIRMYKTLNFLCVEDSYLAFNQLLQLLNEVKKRLKKRKNYNITLINQFKKIQLPIEKKKKKSDFIIKNDFKMRTVKKYVKNN